MKKIALMFFALLTGCSDGSVTFSTPQVYEDERSQIERYKDCISLSRKGKSKSERARCADKARSADSDYKGVSLPINF